MSAAFIYYGVFGRDAILRLGIGRQQNSSIDNLEIEGMEA